MISHFSRNVAFDDVWHKYGNMKFAIMMSRGPLVKEKQDIYLIVFETIITLMKLKLYQYKIGPIL